MNNTPNQQNSNYNSHTHCWLQSVDRGCGIALEDHKQCCLCDTPYHPVQCANCGGNIGKFKDGVICFNCRKAFIDFPHQNVAEENGDVVLDGIGGFLDHISKIDNYLKGRPEICLQDCHPEERENLKSFISSLILNTRKQEQDRISEGLCVLFDKLESNDPDQSGENWRNYKFIRNNIRDYIKSLSDNHKM